MIVNVGTGVYQYPTTRHQRRLVRETYRTARRGPLRQNRAQARLRSEALLGMFHAEEVAYRPERITQ